MIMGDVQRRDNHEVEFTATQNFKCEKTRVSGIFFEKSTEPLSLGFQAVSKVQGGGLYDSFKFTLLDSAESKQEQWGSFFQNGFY